MNESGERPIDRPVPAVSPGFRGLPAVHAVLDEPALARPIAAEGRSRVVATVRDALAEARAALGASGGPPPSAAELARRAAALLEADAPPLRAVINATGILLHTGLGRAPLAPTAIEAVARACAGYCDLEFDLEGGERGKRTSRIAARLRRLTGAEAATVVNNNAAATVLALRALALGKEVIVSRGQLVEIGGSFRLPEIFEASGAKLREVGTTNKTRLDDYERAIGPETAALLRVHPSNYRIVGFAEAPGVAEMAALARSRGLWMIDDIGSGALAPGLLPGAEGEPTIAEGLAAGADLILGSGDKLLGGPQCGLMVGSAAAIARVSADPLMRAFRVDKMTLAALAETLRLAGDHDLAARSIPLWSFVHRPIDRLRERAAGLAERIDEELGVRATVEESTAYLGGGSSPVAPLPSVAVRLLHPFGPEALGESALARRLRLGSPAVVGRAQGGALILDLKAVAEVEFAQLFDAVRAALAGGIHTPCPERKP